jgi:hypothetical protein
MEGLQEFMVVVRALEPVSRREQPGQRQWACRDQVLRLRGTSDTSVTISSHKARWRLESKMDLRPMPEARGQILDAVTLERERLADAPASLRSRASLTARSRST